MPKTIVSSYTMPIILHEIDKWQGKLTWELFVVHLAKVLHEKSIGRHTLIRYPIIKDAFDSKKELLRESNRAKSILTPTLEMALIEIETLEAKVKRLKKQEALFHEQFVRWGENLRKMPGVDMKRLAEKLDKPLPQINRKKG